MELIQWNKQLQVASEIFEENSRLNDQLSMLEFRLKISQEEHETTKAELEYIRAYIVLQKAEKDAIKKGHIETLERLKELEILVEKRHTTRSEFVDETNLLKSQIAEIPSEFRNMEELQKLKKNISILHAKLQKSRSIFEEHQKKWNEEKEQLLMELQASDERIKEVRLKLEFRVENNKNQMKTLCNDEVAKVKRKHECEIAVMNSKLDALKDQNVKYEEHIRKLSSQIFHLNENILEHQKQNAFLKTKVEYLETKPQQFSRITASQLPRSSNLHKEEGEVYNNSYLSDLKTARMSEVFSGAHELQCRQSLLDPHWQSTNLAHFDRQMEEDELRAKIVRQHNTQNGN